MGFVIDFFESIIDIFSGESRDDLLEGQRAENSAREAQRRLEEQRERRRQAREARAQAAVADNQGAVQGVSTSTVQAGAVSGVQSGAAGNLGFLSASSANLTALNKAIGQQQTALNQIQVNQDRLALAQTVFSIASVV